MRRRGDGEACATGKRVRNFIQEWTQAVRPACEELMVTGFVAPMSVTYLALFIACAKAALPKALRKA